MSNADVYMAKIMADMRMKEYFGAIFNHSGDSLAEEGLKVCIEEAAENYADALRAYLEVLNRENGVIRSHKRARRRAPR